MKLLIDNCISHLLATALRSHGHDVESVADWPSDPGDRSVLAAATRDGRVLITADREFGELVVFERLPSAGIIVLDSNITPAQHEEACRRAIAAHESELLGGAVVIVMPDRMRARTPDPDA